MLYFRNAECWLQNNQEETFFFLCVLSWKMKHTFGQKERDLHSNFTWPFEKVQIAFEANECWQLIEATLCSCIICMLDADAILTAFKISVVFFQRVEDCCASIVLKWLENLFQDWSFIILISSMISFCSFHYFNKIFKYSERV